MQRRRVRVKKRFEKSGRLAVNKPSGKVRFLVHDRDASFLALDGVLRSDGIRIVRTPRAAEVRLATLYWKPNANVTDLRPHYHVRETDAWIVFPHELEGLTAGEIRQKDPALARCCGWPAILDSLHLETSKAGWW